MSLPVPTWYLLVVSLPTSGATARMRVWRALKALGCMALRDGAYLLPAHADHERALQELADECTAEGGNAWLMSVQPRSAEEADAYRQLFDRSDDYAELRKSWKEANRGLAGLAAPELARMQRRLQREFDAVRAIDFFPGEASLEAEAAWTEFGNRIAELLSPGEPQPGSGHVRRLDAADYRGRTWATRRRPWIDRVASAWLIRRYIDPEAHFRWLVQPSDCPKTALGFDFDGGTFTHVGNRVTFETLMTSFGLEGHAALRRLAEIVHTLDVGGEPMAEARGLEAVLSGAHVRLSDDDALLDEMCTVLDSLLAHFERETGRRKGNPKGTER